MSHDENYMLLALSLAKASYHLDEVPVGAVLVAGNKIISTGLNLKESHTNPCFHAEMIAIMQGASHLKSWRLSSTTLYVTLEPCAMCAGALIQARINRLVFGAFDPKGGACGSLYQIHQDPRLNHRIETLGGFMEEESAILLKSFFRTRRLQRSH